MLTNNTVAKISAQLVLYGPLGRLLVVVYMIALRRCSFTSVTSPVRVVSRRAGVEKIAADTFGTTKASMIDRERRARLWPL
jgi:hypothetical protein